MGELQRDEVESNAHVEYKEIHEKKKKKKEKKKDKNKERDVSQA